jgi:hypothetical protein
VNCGKIELLSRLLPVIFFPLSGRGIRVLDVEKTISPVY